MTILGGVTVGGGSGIKRIAVDVPGNLRSLLEVGGSAEIQSIHVAGDVLRPLLASDASTIDNLTIDGSIAATGEVSAGNIRDMSVGGDLKGVVRVSGILGRLRIGGASPGKVVAGDVGVITAANATGPVVLDVTEAGVTRQVIVTPADPARPSLADVHFAYVYDSTGPGNPQLALRLTNGNPASRGDDTPIDLAITSAGATDSTWRGSTRWARRAFATSPFRGTCSRS